MKTHDLLICGNLLSIVVEGKDSNLEQGLPRETCPSCGKADCCNACDGSQGADEDNRESEEDAINRQRYNAALNAIENIALAHACAGIDISNPAYVEGLEAASEVAGNEYLENPALRIHQPIRPTP